ncbi:MAG: linear amide C-N hydrolase [Chloroflexi bacterium]|nr:linear amide C-N hydrolase [Chloroflexota bacterium]
MKKLLSFITILFLVSGCSQPQPPSATPKITPVTATSEPVPASQSPTAALIPTDEPPLPDSDNGVLAFTSAQDGNMEIYVMDVAGGAPQRLTNHPGEDYWPTWSPDGAQIAFASERDGDFEIYAMNADGLNLRRLTHEPGNDLEPNWSPDGSQIAFMVYQAGKSDVYIMNTDGGGRRPLTDSEGDNYLPQWSPDGGQIVFVSERDGNPEIYVMNADGSDQRRLTDNVGEDSYPSWSSDGRQITFYSERDGGRELYAMDADGHFDRLSASSSPQPLTYDNASVWVSDWSPDGNQIAFTSSRDGNREIYFMDIDGGNFRRLTDNNVLDGIPAWRPVVDQGRADGLSAAEAATLSSLEQVDDYPLYTMRYDGAYNQREAVAVAGSSWACSLFAALGDEENMVYGRNFDWRYSPALLLFTDPPDGYASVSMVDIEYLVGTENAGQLLDLPLEEREALLNAPFLPFDGMNEHGLAIGMAAVPPGNAPPDPEKETVDSLLVMRRVLDQARDVDEAVAILQSYNIEWGGGPDLHYLVADRSGRSMLIEFYQGETHIIPNPANKPWHQATNFLRVSVGESAAGACGRYDHMSEGLMEVDGRLTTANAMTLLAQVAQENTQWSIVYGLSAGDVTVTMGQNYDNQHTFIFSEETDE